MATHKLDLTKLLLPASSAVYVDSSANLDTNDVFPHEVLVFTDSGTRISASCSFVMPNNYVGSPVVNIRWRTAAAGDVVWDVDAIGIAGDNAESGDPAAVGEALTVTDGAGTALRLMATSVNLTGASYAADDLVLLKLSRDGADAADTLAGSAWIEALQLTYADS